MSKTTEETERRHQEFWVVSETTNWPVLSHRLRVLRTGLLVVPEYRSLNPRVAVLRRS